MSTAVIHETTPLHAFVCNEVLSEDSFTNTVILLGTLPAPDCDPSQLARAILKIEKTPLTSHVAQRIAGGALQTVRLIDRNDIYSWLHGWIAVDSELPDVKLSVICPATDVHVQKYSAQPSFMVHETPTMYREIVEPYILSFPQARTQWVDDIITGKSESDKVLHWHTSPPPSVSSHSIPDADTSYIILPDMKWDTTTLSSLYLVAIAASRAIRSLRDLRKIHLPFLRSIRREATRIVQEKWGLKRGQLRFFVHYQPSYYHFHVHVVHVDYVGLPGMHTGHAHLLDDIISLLELDPDDGPGIFERMTLTYSLGERHALYPLLEKAHITADEH